MGIEKSTNIKFLINNSVFLKIFLSSWLIIALITLANAGCLTTSKNLVAKALNAPQFARIMSIEIASCDAISIDTDNVMFQLFENTQKTHNGIRAEVAVNYPFEEGDDVSYKIDMMIPEDFKSDAPKNRWWSLIQWHDQPNIRIGQNWANYPKVPPPVSVYIEARDGVIGIGLNMFGNNKVSWVPIPLGEWSTLSVNFHWSTQDDGRIDFKVLGHPDLSSQFIGKNMINSYQHYLKFGQYRHPEIQTNNVVYFRNLSIQPSK